MTVTDEPTVGSFTYYKYQRSGDEFCMYIKEGWIGAAKLEIKFKTTAYFYIYRTGGYKVGFDLDMYGFTHDNNPLANCAEFELSYDLYRDVSEDIDEYIGTESVFVSIKLNENALGNLFD